MDLKIFKRASVLALTAVLLMAAVALADTIPADGDLVAPDNQTFIELGAHAPGEIVTRDVGFSLTCAGIAHADFGQTITLQLSSVTVPLNGAATATSTTIGPVPAAWTDDGEGCPFPAPTLPSNGLSTVTLRMPTTPDEGYIFTVMWARLGANGLTGLTAISFSADVVVNTPPVLSLPGAINAEGSQLGGAVVTYAASAADAEDDPDPVPACAPTSGSVFPIGTTTVSCSVTDSGGMSASGSFTVTVGDTTAPVLVLPANQSVEATSAAGASVAFSVSASDIVDGAVSVDCDSDSGDVFPLGTTLVSCSATDAAGNTSSGSFTVTVGDTTAPVLGDMPADQSLTTSNPAGATLTYALPSATDAVDASPDVSCVPASGSTVPVGVTTVTCTARDDAGNTSSDSFDVSVTFVSTVTYTIAWGEPIGGSPASLVANQGRTVPIKLEIFANGTEVQTGSVSLRVVACGGGDPLVVPLDWGSGRWNGHLDTSSLRPGCYQATVVANGDDADSFALDLRGAEATKASGASNGNAAKDKPPKK